MTPADVAAAYRRVLSAGVACDGVRVQRRAAVSGVRVRRLAADPEESAEHKGESEEHKEDPEERAEPEEPEERAEPEESEEHKGGEGRIVVSGVALRYGDETAIHLEDNLVIRERVVAGALRLPEGPVMLTRQHDRGRLLTEVTYQDSPEMLRFEAEFPASLPPGSEQAQAVWDMEHSLLRGASVEFQVLEFEVLEGEQGVVEVTAAEMLPQMSLVDRPAFDDSRFSMRQEHAALAPLSDRVEAVTSRWRRRRTWIG